MNKSAFFKHLDWDSSFFGFKVAAIIPLTLSQLELETACSMMKDENIALSYWKTPNQLQNFPSHYTVKLADIACVFSINLPIETNTT